MTDQKEKGRIGRRIGKFFKEIRTEMKKVIWPTRQQLVNYTLVVFTACLVVGVVIWVADAGLGLLFCSIFGKLKRKEGRSFGLRFLMADEAKWYVVHTYSGYENKAKANIEKIVENRKMQDYILDVGVPMEEQIEIKDGKMRATLN